MIRHLFLLTTALTLMLVTNAQQPGRVKITFAGFKCIRETNDDMLQKDGKGDEVFFQFYFTMAGSNGVTKLSYANRSDIYGDATGPFSNRISAGSCTDLLGGAKGGIRAGDNCTANKIIGEYDLAAGDVLTVVPTIWEWDPGTGLESSFDATINGAYTVINQKATNISQNRLGAGLSAGSSLLGYFLVDGSTSLSLRAFFNIVGDLGPRSRPVGITTNGDYSPKAVLFNANIMQSIANSNFGYGPGIIPVQYNEEALGNSRDHGNYIILLKVDFTPKPGSAPAPAPAPSSGNGYVPPPNPGARTNTPPPPAAQTTPTNQTTPTSQTTPTNPTSPASPAVAPTPAKPVMSALPPAIAKPLTNPNGTLRTLNTGAANTNAAVGVWSGTFGYGMLASPNFLSMRFNADGTMQVLANSGAVQATGTYTYNNNQVMGRYTYSANNVSNSFAGTIDASGTLIGTWGAGANASGSGNWKMTKK